MLSELIFKQFAIGGTDSRPTSALTEFKNDDDKDNAMMYTQEPSQLLSPVSRDKTLSAMPNQGPVNQISDNATTIPAKTPAQINQIYIPAIERSATQQNNSSNERIVDREQGSKSVSGSVKPLADFLQSESVSQKDANQASTFSENK